MKNAPPTEPTEATESQTEKWILGVESSCDETAVALLRVCQQAGGGKSTVIAERLASQTALHSAHGGVVPEVAARAHAETLPRLAEEVLAEAQKYSVRSPDLIAATAGPGLVGGLAAGVVFARALSWAWGVPFMAVNHLAAHALSPRISSSCISNQIAFPYFLLLVSGGHCQLLGVRTPQEFRLYGETLDDAAGEVFDKVARGLGFAWPGGPHLAQAAEHFADTMGGRESALMFVAKHKILHLPQTNLRTETTQTETAQFPFSFSGLKTASLRRIQELQQSTDKEISGNLGFWQDGLAFAFEESVTRQLVGQTASALEVFLDEEAEALRQNPNPPVLAVAGGVGANRTLRKALETLALTKGLRFCPPAPALCTDNAVMVAHLAGEILQATRVNSQQRDLDQIQDLPVRPRWPLVA